MRNGLTKTLAAIAIACLGYQAYAVAPVVNSIPAVFVTDDASPTSPNKFVYEDALNLNNYVSDDGPLGNLLWSFKGGLGGGASAYRLNGADPLTTAESTSATVLITPGAKQINSTVPLSATGEYNTDANVNTVTFRDIIQSPFGGPDTAPAGPPPAGSIVRTETVTVYASDGTTASLGKSLLIVTQMAGNDHLSVTPAPTPIRDQDLHFQTTTNGWFTGQQLGSATFSSAGGLCISVTAAGASVGEWISPWSVITMAANQVWRLRATMTTTQNTPGSVPLYDYVVQNLNTDPVNGSILDGDQAFIADFMFLDNLGSKNAIKGPAAGRNTFDMWFAPAAVSTAQWNNGTTGGVAAANDADNDARVVLRVLDVDNIGYGGEVDSGHLPDRSGHRQVRHPDQALHGGQPRCLHAQSDHLRSERGDG
jgi:hypothetical protein